MRYINHKELTLFSYKFDIAIKLAVSVIKSIQKYFNL